MVDEGDETAPSAVTGAVPTEGLVVGEVSVSGNLRELALLQADDSDPPILEEVRQLHSAVLNPIAVELQESTNRGLGRRAVTEGG